MSSQSVVGRAAIMELIRPGWRAREYMKTGMDRRVTQALHTEILAGKMFATVPADKAETVLSVAIPIVLWMFLAEHRRENVLYKLPSEKRNAIIDFLHLRGRTMVLHLGVSPLEIEAYISHLLAAFAYTTLFIPKVVTMEEVVSYCFDKAYGREDTSFLSAAFLVIKSPLTECVGLTKALGNVKSFIADRCSFNRVTVFVDITGYSINEALGAGKSGRALVERYIVHDSGCLRPMQPLFVNRDVYFSLPVKFAQLEKWNK